MDVQGNVGLEANSVFFRPMLNQDLFFNCLKNFSKYRHQKVGSHCPLSPNPVLTLACGGVGMDLLCLNEDEIVLVIITQVFD